jgi:drug/metabolite transporter (DMT)-like permease
MFKNTTSQSNSTLNMPIDNPEAPTLKKWLVLIFLALIWGSSFILIKKGLVVFSPPQTAAVRIVAAFCTLGAFSYISLKKVPRSKWGYLFISGMIGTFIPAFLFAYAQTRLESALAGVLNSLTPVFTFLVGWLFFSLRLRIKAILGLLLGFLGAISLILMGKELGTLDPNPYGLLVILAAILYGCNLNFVKHYLKDLKALHISSLVMLFISPLALATFFIEGVPQTIQTNPASGWALAALVGLGVLSTGVATIFFNRLLLISSPVFASSVTYLIPIVAIFWGLIDGEQLILGHYLSMGIIIIGVWMVNSSK